MIRISLSKSDNMTFTGKPVFSPRTPACSSRVAGFIFGLLEMTQAEFDAEKARQLAALKEWEQKRNGRK